MDEVRDKLDKMMELYEELKREVRQRNKHLYERWKAGGFLIDNDIVSMYPTLGQVIDQLPDDEDEECEHDNAVLTDGDDPPTYHCPDCGEDFIGGDE